MPEVGALLPEGDDHVSVTTRGIRLETVRARPAETVEWQFSEPANTVLVWRKGTAKLKETLNASGRLERIDLRPSSVWTIPADSNVSACARQTTALEFHRVTIDSNLVGADGLRAALTPRDVVLHSLLERIASTEGRDDVVAKLLRDALFDATRLHILDAYGAGRGARGSRGRALSASARERLTEFMHDGLDREISLEAMAEIAGMSVRTFRRSFPAEFGTTPHQYLLDLRIGRAKELLITTRLSVAEVGALAGFSRPSHFASTFKNRVGISPTQFRASRT